MEDEIMVSVYCTAYNHEKYIRDALEGFVNQKTNFKYEVLVHDDASTDNTAKIIKEYEKKYPDIIKPIYQKENQFSKGKAISLILDKLAKGKYIALCEGDDYWIDENKLQIQVDYMEEHPDCTFCFHNANIYDMRINKITKVFLPTNKKQKKYFTKDNKYNMGEIALLDEIPTASYMYRKKFTFPKLYERAIAGDICVQTISTYYGYGYYIDKVMSMYRVGTGQSVMDTWRKNAIDYKKEIERYNKYIKIYEDINKFSKYQYNDIMNRIIMKFKLAVIFINPNPIISKENYNEILKSKYLNKTSKIKFFIKIKTPKLFNLLKRIKQAI